MNQVAEREMHFFWGSGDPLSNWYMRDFVVKGKTFCCNEQFMMYCKAMLFKDYATAEEIMTVVSPWRHKELGREVKGFVEKIWVEHREHYVYVGALAKFQQNSDLKEILLATTGKELVEAAAHDTIWGVGLDKDSPAIKHRRLWRGLNLLGKVLELVRDALDPGIPLKAPT